jgi:hypothetical protein
MTDDDTMALLARVRWLETEVQRLIEHAAQAEADRDTLAAEVMAWRDVSSSHELRALQAEWDRDTLAAELRAWHDACYPSSAVDARREEILTRRIYLTQSSGALQRAKEVK